MSDWGHSEGAQRAETFGVTPANSSTATIAYAGSANVKSAWVELVAAAPFDVCGIVIHGSMTASALTDALYDIGIGAAASEVVLLPDIKQTRLGSLNAGFPSFFVPISIPAGTRIAARYQASGNSVFKLALTLIGAGSNYTLPGHRAASYGCNLAISKGTLIDPGAVAHTKSPWFELAASTDFASNFLVVITAPEGGSTADAQWLVDLAIGAAGSEQIVVPDIYGYNVGSTGLNYRLGLPVSIPAGSRISARAQCTATTGFKVFQISLLAVG